MSRASIHPITRTEQDLIRDVRDARFPAGLRCPRCASQGVIRWGRFTGRQRYRCAGCRRTFSDLTGTPMAYSKRLALWPAYLRLFQRSATVRECAAALGVHVCTAFRWRHATLGRIRGHPLLPLQGTIEMVDLAFPLSFKGRRDLDGEGRRRSARVLGGLPCGFPRTRVVLLRSRSGAVRGTNVLEHVLTAYGLGRFLQHGVRPGSVIHCRYRRFSPVACAVRATGSTLVTVSVRLTASTTQLLGESEAAAPHVDNVEAYGRRFTAWLERFRGVATRYLSNYIAWYCHLDRFVLESRISSCLTSAMPWHAPFSVD